MFEQMNSIVNKFDNVILSVVEPTQEMIDIVAEEWEKQHKLGFGIDLDSDTCKGLTQLQIDKTTKWLYSNN